MHDEPTDPKISVPYDQFMISGMVYWVEANGYKPHLLVNMKWPGVIAPPQCMAKARETFNLSSTATARVNWCDDRVEFNSRFNGKDFRLTIPYHAIITVSFAGTGAHQMLPWTHIAGAEQQPEAPRTFKQQESLGEHSQFATEEPLKIDIFPTPEKVELTLAPDATPEGKSNVVAFDFTRRSKK